MTYVSWLSEMAELPARLLTTAPFISYCLPMAKRTGRPPGLIPDGPEIERLRVHGLRISTRELGLRIGFSRASVRHAERGRPISDVFASRLAHALGVEVKDIARPPGDRAAAA
jgi:hypothetical protein